MGRELARRAGIDGESSVVVLDGGDPVRASLLPDTPRAVQWADSLVVLAPPSALVDECWVELDPAAAAVWPQVEAVIDGARPLSVGPVDRESLRQTPEEVRVTTLSTWRGGLAVGVIALLVCLLAWWGDREGWALYAAIGFGRGAIHAMALVDWALLTLAPIVAGTLWGSLAGADGDAALEPSVRLIAVAVALAAFANPWLRVLLARLSLRRALAGL